MDRVGTQGGGEGDLLGLGLEVEGGDGDGQLIGAVLACDGAHAGGRGSTQSAVHAHAVHGEFRRGGRGLERKIDVPDGLLEMKVKQYVQQFTNQNCKEDTTLADYLTSNYNMTEEDLRRSVRAAMNG